MNELSKYDYADPDRKNYSRVFTSSTAAYRLHYHIVFATKYREKLLVGPIKERCLEKIIEVCRNKAYHLLAVRIMEDHVHFLLSLRPHQAISDVVRFLKSNTAKVLLEEFPYLETRVKKRSIWSDSYFAGTVGKSSTAAIKAYLDRQDEQHIKGE